MKSLLCSLVGLICSLSVQAAGNLVVNGDFQTGTLAPWTPVGDATVNSMAAKLGSSAAGSGGEISQTIATEADTRYYFSMVVQDATPDKIYGQAVRVRFENNGSIYKDVSFLLFGSGVEHFAVPFVATGQTTLRISTTYNVTLVDDVSVVPLPSNRLAGHYQGTAKLSYEVGVSGFEETVSARRTDRVVARVYDTGEFVMLRDADQIASGIFLPGDDSAFVVRSNGFWFTGTATFAGRSIKFTSDPLLNVPYTADSGGIPLERSAKLDVTLTRDGK